MFLDTLILLEGKQGLSSDSAPRFSASGVEVGTEKAWEYIQMKDKFKNVFYNKMDIENARLLIKFLISLEILSEIVLLQRNYL